MKCVCVCVYVCVCVCVVCVVCECVCVWYVRDKDFFKFTNLNVTVFSTGLYVGELQTTNLKFL